MNRPRPSAYLLGLSLLVAACTNTAFPSQNSSSGSVMSAVSSHTDLQTYEGQAVHFQYPPVLTLTDRGPSVTLAHSVPYDHPDPCDMKGDGKRLAQLTDFSMTMSVMPGSLPFLMGHASSLISFEDGMPKTESGFVDSVAYGPHTGYKVTMGVEGCGEQTYYFPLSTTQTLVISRPLVSELQPIVDPAVRQKILAMPGVMFPEEAESIFGQIVASIRLP